MTEEKNYAKHATELDLRKVSDNIEEIRDIKTELLTRQLFGWIVDSLLKGEAPEYSSLVSPQIPGRIKDNFMDFGQWCDACHISKALENCLDSKTKEYLKNYNDDQLALGLMTELHFVYDLFIDNINEMLSNEYHADTEKEEDNEKEDR